MTIYLRRQNSVRVCEGNVASLSEGYVFPFRLTDVLPKYVLKLANGKYTQNSARLAATESLTVALPAGYDTTEKLACVVRSTETIKAVIVDPDLGTSTHLIKSTSGTTEGNHFGVLQWQGRITSITLSVPTAFDTALVDWFLWEIPDLTDPDSWQIGTQATGVVSSV